MARPDNLLDSEWFKGLSKEEIEDRKSFLLSNKKVLDILQEIVYNIRIAREKTNFSDYDSPSWSHKQAHTNGYTEALRRVEALIKLTK